MRNKKTVSVQIYGGPSILSEEVCYKNDLHSKPLLKSGHSKLLKSGGVIWSTSTSLMTLSGISCHSSSSHTHMRTSITLSYHTYFPSIVGALRYSSSLSVQQRSITQKIKMCEKSTLNMENVQDMMSLNDKKAHSTSLMRLSAPKNALVKNFTFYFDRLLGPIRLDFPYWGTSNSRKNNSWTLPLSGNS